ncbi:hypothetical protein TNCV_1837441 [Trichonephila clavipes]|nr:hypothetical protein TNCV_1837441 [Trichonephila clavipes]
MNHLRLKLEIVEALSASPPTDKISMSKQQDEDHKRDATQRYPTHVQSVTYPANMQAKEEAVPTANQDRI